MPLEQPHQGGDVSGGVVAILLNDNFIFLIQLLSSSSCSGNDSGKN